MVTACYHTDAPDDAIEVASKEPVNSTNRLADAFGRTTIQEGTQAQQEGLSMDMLERGGLSGTKVSREAWTD